MSEAIRDVTVRVNVEGGKIGKMPDFDKLTIAAESFYNTVDEGTRLLTSSMGDVRTATTAVIDEFASIADIEIPSDGFDDLTAAAEAFATTAEDGMESAVTATEGLADAMQQVVTATETAAEATVEATANIETATQAEGKSATQIAFDKIRLAERYAAFQRKAAEESKKQSSDTAAAAKKAGEEAQQQMFAAGGAIAQSMAAGAQFVSTLRLIGGESKHVEELARTFASVQATVQGLAAGSQAFGALNTGLRALQASAAATSVSLAATGASATATQSALLFLAPAAATATAALGPISVAVAAIALGVTAVMAISSYFGEDVPDDADKVSDAYERATEHLQKMKRQLDANTLSIKTQNSLLRMEIDLRHELAGTAETAPAITEKQESDVRTATSGANAKIQEQRNSALEEKKELEKEREELLKNTKSEKSVEERAESSGQSTSKIKSDDRKKLAELDQRIESLRNAGKAGEDVALSPETMSEFAAELNRVAPEFRAAFQSTLDEYAANLRAADSTARAELESATKENAAAIHENTEKQKELIDAYNQERDIAVRLQNDPTQSADITKGINTAANAGDLNAGIDALGGVVSSEMESELRGLLAEGNLTRERLLEELADASEFETEKAILEKAIEEQKGMAQVLLNTKEQLAKAMEEAKNAGQELLDEVRNTQAAVQQR